MWLEGAVETERQPRADKHPLVSGGTCTEMNGTPGQHECNPKLGKQSISHVALM